MFDKPLLDEPFYQLSNYDSEMREIDDDDYYHYDDDECLDLDVLELEDPWSELYISD